MKLFKNIFVLAAALFLAVSCVESAVDPLDDIYPEVQQLNLGQTLSDGGVTEESGLNVFCLEADGLSLLLTGNNWYLEPGEYVFSDQLKNKAVLTPSSVSGKSITKGNVTVEKDGDEYSVSALFWLSDEVVKVKATGTIVYEYKTIEPNFSYTTSLYENRGYNLTFKNLDGSFAANFLLLNTSTVTGDYEVSADSENATDKIAFVGIDLSMFGLGILGSYFDEAGTRWFIQGGSLSVSGDESMYSVEVSSMVAVNALGEAYPQTSKSFSNAMKESPKPVVIEGGSFTHSEILADGVVEHTLSLKDVSGKSSGRIVIVTAPLGGVMGSFAEASPLAPASDKVNKYLAGFDASVFGMGILGSYITIDSKQYMLSGEELKIEANGDKFDITLNGPSIQGLNASSVILSGLSLDSGVKEEILCEVEGGTYLLTSAPKADAEGIMEHTFIMFDKNGLPSGQILIWSSDDNYKGSWSFVSPTSTAEPGHMVGGLELDLSAFGLGVNNLGSYFVKDGKTYLLTSGEASVCETAGVIDIVITGVEASTGASAGSEPSDVTVVSFKGMTPNPLMGM